MEQDTERTLADGGLEKQDYHSSGGMCFMSDCGEGKRGRGKKRKKKPAVEMADRPVGFKEEVWNVLQAGGVGGVVRGVESVRVV